LWKVHKTYDRRMGIRRRTRPGAPEVHAITSAPASLADDQARRRRRYLTQMSVRVVCFLLVVLLWRYLPLAVGITLAVAATVLPYIAVLGANAGRGRRDVDPHPFARELPAAPPRDGIGGAP